MESKQTDYSFPEFKCVVNSGSYVNGVFTPICAVGSERGWLQYRLPNTVQLSNKPHFMKVVASKIPLTNYNVTTALANRTLRYSMDSTAEPIVWKTVTLAEGRYDSIDIINTAVQFECKKNSDFIVNTSGETVFPYYLSADPASSKGVITINTAYHSDGKTEYKTVDVDLTNGGTSNLYKLFGFTALEAVLNAQDAVYYSISTNNIDIYDGKFYITCNLVESSFVDLSSRQEVLCCETFYGEANTYYNLPNTYRKDIIGLLRKEASTLNMIELKIVDRDFKLIKFADNSRDSDVWFEIYIY